MARQDVSLGDDDVESSTESIIREPALSPDQVRALSPPACRGTPTSPVSIESMVKPVQQQQHSESPLVERDRTKFPEAQNYGQQQSNLASANGITVHNMKAGSASNITTDLIRDVKARDVELETLRHREAWMRAALAQRTIQVRNLAFPMWLCEVELCTGKSYRTGMQRVTAH